MPTSKSISDNGAIKRVTSSEVPSDCMLKNAESLITNPFVKLMLKEHLQPSAPAPAPGNQVSTASVDKERPEKRLKSCLHRHGCRSPRTQSSYSCRSPRTQSSYSCRSPRTQSSYSCRSPKMDAEPSSETVDLRRYPLAKKASFFDDYFDSNSKLASVNTVHCSNRAEVVNINEIRKYIDKEVKQYFAAYTLVVYM